MVLNTASQRPVIPGRNSGRILLRSLVNKYCYCYYVTAPLCKHALWSQNWADIGPMPPMPAGMFTQFQSCPPPPPPPLQRSCNPSENVLLAIYYWTRNCIVNGTIGKKFRWIWIKIQLISFRKINLKMLPAINRPFCLGLHVFYLLWTPISQHQRWFEFTACCSGSRWMSVTSRCGVV